MMTIRVDLKIFLFLLIFFLTNQIEIYILFMTFAIAHELGHLLIGILLGFRPKEINFIPMGLSIQFSVNYTKSSKKIANKKKLKLKKIFIIMAGPVTNFLISFFFIIFDMNIVSNLRENIIYSNLIIGFFNLIPIYPLDGGRIVKCIVNMKKNLVTSYKYTNFISKITLITLTAISSIAILYLKNIAILFIILYLWGIVIKENNIYINKMKLYKTIENIKLRF